MVNNVFLNQIMYFYVFRDYHGIIFIVDMVMAMMIMVHIVVKLNLTIIMITMPDILMVLSKDMVLDMLVNIQIL